MVDLIDRSAIKYESCGEPSNKCKYEDCKDCPRAVVARDDIEKMPTVIKLYKNSEYKMGFHKSQKWYDEKENQLNILMESTTTCIGLILGATLLHDICHLETITKVTYWICGPLAIIFACLTITLFCITEDCKESDPEYNKEKKYEEKKKDQWL